MEKISQEIGKITPGYIEFNLKQELYDRLTKDTVVEWRLHFQDSQIGDREAWGSVKKFELKKRSENGIFAGPLQLNTADGKYTLFLAPDGRFVMKRIFRKVYVRSGLKGEYTVGTSEGKTRIRLIPKYGISFDLGTIDQNGSGTDQILLPELLKIIFDYANSAPNTFIFPERKFEQLRRLSMVCKYWFVLFTKTLPQLFDGEFVDANYQKHIKFSWAEFKYS